MTNSTQIEEVTKDTHTKMVCRTYCSYCGHENTVTVEKYPTSAPRYVPVKTPRQSCEKKWGQSSIQYHLALV